MITIINPSDLIGGTIIGIQTANEDMPASFHYKYLVVKLTNGENVKLDVSDLEQDCSY